MTQTSTDSREARFIEALARLAQDNDRGALAALRRGLGRPPGTVPELFPYIIPLFHDPKDLPFEWACFVVAPLFALHPLPWPEGDHGGPHSLGASFGQLSQKTGRCTAVERRLTRLLAADRNELPDLLRHAVTLLKGQDIPVDWVQLTKDLQRWDHPERWVQRAWARDYYRVAPTNAQP